MLKIKDKSKQKASKQRVPRLSVGRPSHLSLADEELEALREARARAVRLGQRAHHLGVVRDEHWRVDRLLLCGGAKRREGKGIGKG